MHFRADAIVRDAECIRRALVGDAPWSVLGQSYGGFCAVTYLSLYPEGLAEVFVTGGLPPLTGHADDYYRHTYTELQRKTARYFARYPEDRALAARILDHLHRHEVTLPAGGRLTVRRFQQAGMVLGMDDGMETLHYLLEDAFCAGADGETLSLPFLRAFENQQHFETNPIYVLLHEMCYTQGEASRWSAQRMRAEFAGVDWAPGQPPSFTGEMVYPWMFEDYAALRPLRETAELLAHEERWPALYDPARLARNTVPCVAIIYAGDMYVPRALSEETASAIAGTKVWLTNENEHSGLRTNPAIIDRLLAMRRDMV
jgi:pimeloyl-ACP methyl ester carboxylesterase